MRELLGAAECGRQIYSSGWVDGAVIPMRRLSRRLDSQAPAVAPRGSPSGLVVMLLVISLVITCRLG